MKSNRTQYNEFPKILCNQGKLQNFVSFQNFQKYQKYFTQTEWWGNQLRVEYALTCETVSSHMKQEGNHNVESMTHNLNKRNCCFYYQIHAYGPLYMLECGYWQNLL